MLGRGSIRKILKKYKNKSIKDLSSTERTEVLKIMDQSLEKSVINLFVRDDNGIVSARSMSMPTYLTYMQNNRGSTTVGELIKTLQNEEY